MTTFNCWPPAKSFLKESVKIIWFFLVPNLQVVIKISVRQGFEVSKIRFSGMLMVMRVVFVIECVGVKSIV